MEQIERTRRYLKRVRDIYAGVPYIKKGMREYYVDDVLSFFIHCYHIADWIVTLNVLGVKRENVDTFINAHPELRICADLCNGTKHCDLRNKRTKRQPHLGSWSFESDGTNGVFHTTKGEFQILSDGNWYDALDLAESCMRLWDDFVAELKTSANH